MPSSDNLLVAVNGRTFRNEIVILDGHAFEDCRFIECELQFAAEREMSIAVDCKMLDCSLRLAGRAAFTVDFLRQIDAFGLTGPVDLILAQIKRHDDRGSAN
ncbi:hypothetical protein [Sphingobium sp. LSP13-1-1.1]|uniref:hypothetical protein n=1 Tax=Sphingobium sp. LSP13-1-1.1 TaxID=3135234 RepID=UPI00344A88B9